MMNWPMVLVWAVILTGAIILAVNLSGWVAGWCGDYGSGACFASH